MSRHDQTPTRVKLILDEVLMGRVEPTRQGVRAYVDDVYQGLMAIERTTVVSGVMAQINSWKTEKENRPMTEPKRVLGGKDLAAVAAGYFREDPDARASDVYDRMLGDGHRIGVKRPSFVSGGIAASARRLAESGEAIDAPKPPPQEPNDAGDVQEEAEDSEPEPAEAEPVAEPEPPEVDEEPEPEPVAVTRASNGLPVDTGDGDYVRFSLGGQKLDAQREGEEWDVAFEGTVGDGMVRELLGRMFGGSS